MIKTDEPPRLTRTFFAVDDHVVSNDKGQWQARVVRIVSPTQMKVVWDINNAESLVDIRDFSHMFDLTESMRPIRHRRKPNRFIEGDFHLQKCHNPKPKKPKRRQKLKREEPNDDFLAEFNARSINVSDLVVDHPFFDSSSEDDGDDE